MSYNQMAKIIISSIAEIAEEIARVHVTRDKVVFSDKNGNFLERFPQGLLSLEDLETLFHILRKTAKIFSVENVFPGYGSCAGELVEFGVDRVTTTTLPARVGVTGAVQTQEFVNSMHFIITALVVDALVGWDEEKDKPINETVRLYVAK